MTGPADRERVKAEAVADLRAALSDGTDVAAALRSCWYRHPLFASTLMGEAVRLRFEPGCDVRLVTRFVARMRAGYDGKADNFPRREAEAVIRACLGELELLDAVPPSRFSYPELGIAILGGLFQEWQPGDLEIADLFLQVDQALQAVIWGFPELESNEDDWFALGMHISPFAAPLADSLWREKDE